LWSMVEACITSDNSDFSEPEERGDLLMRYAHIEELLEACFLLVGKRGGGAEKEGADEVGPEEDGGNGMPGSGEEDRKGILGSDEEDDEGG